MNDVVLLFAGFDPREEAGYHTFASSVIHRATQPVAIAPVWSPFKHDGTNAFTYQRFAIPEMLNYNGWAIFVDGSDMVCLGDIAELWGLRDYSKCVQVVQHDYKTKHPRKYVGTKMEADNRDYPGKNRSSVMLMNCRHPDWYKCDPKKQSGEFLHNFGFTDRVGSLPCEWNWLADEYGQNPAAKLVHWTAGLPAIPHYSGSPMADRWFTEHRRINNVPA